MAMQNTTSFAASEPASGTGRRAVTAFFDDRGTAQAAIDDLIASGLERSRVTLVEGGAEPVAHEAVPSDHKGLWQTVKEFFMADEDRYAYGEGLRRGGFLVSVETGDGDHDRIVDILDRDGAVDIDARAADWTLEGWDPARAASDLRPSAAVGPAFGRGEPRSASPTAGAQEVAAARIDPAALEPSAAVGPAFGSTGRRSAAEGPTAIRDPGAVSSRLRTYIDPPARRDLGDTSP